MNSKNHDAIQIDAFYHFTPLAKSQLAQMRETFYNFGKQHHLKGMILIAQEGINGTVSGTKKAMKAFREFIFSDERFYGCHYKTSFYHRHPFFRLKVRLKKEIVTMGQESFCPEAPRGTYVEPQDWNALISRPDICLIDTRNAYEIKIGTFKNAIDPGTESFRDFPAYVDAHLSHKKNQPIAMMCTGGIRCEKASQYLKSQGFSEVYHLKGGILKYLETVPESESLWEGSCFVFDQRVSVKHGLLPSSESLCFGCRRPLSPQEKNEPYFEEGVSCSSCFFETSPEQKSSFRQRQLQIRLSAQRGISHMGESYRSEADTKNQPH